MKIAIFHELDIGGAKRVVVEFAKKLNKNHTVDLYYVDTNKDKDIEYFFNRTFFYKFDAKIWKGKDWKVRLYKDTVELINLFKLHKKIGHDIKNKEYDCIFVHPSKFTQAPFLLSILKNKCIYFCQESLRIVYEPHLSNISNIKFPKNIYEFLIRKLRKRIDSMNFKNALIVLANSHYSKKVIEESYGRKAEICYLGVDVEFFKPLKVNKLIDILFIGNNDWGYDLLIKSLKFFKIRPKVYAVFRESMKSNISDKELVILYNKSKVLVALNRKEPFGLIPLEAMACGLPVIALKEGGYTESIIDEKTGFLTSRNARELYEKINKIIRDEKFRNFLAIKSRKNIFENWTWDKSIERFLKIVKYAN